MPCLHQEQCQQAALLRCPEFQFHAAAPGPKRAQNSETRMHKDSRADNCTMCDCSRMPPRYSRTDLRLVRSTLVRAHGVGVDGTTRRSGDARSAGARPEGFTNDAGASGLTVSIERPRRRDEPQPCASGSGSQSNEILRQSIDVPCHGLRRWGNERRTVKRSRPRPHEFVRPWDRVMRADWRPSLCGRTFNARWHFLPRKAGWRHRRETHPTWP